MDKYSIMEEKQSKSNQCEWDNKIGRNAVKMDQFESVWMLMANN